MLTPFIELFVGFTKEWRAQRRKQSLVCYTSAHIYIYNIVHIEKLVYMYENTLKLVSTALSDCVFNMHCRQLFCFFVFWFFGFTWKCWIAAVWFCLKTLSLMGRFKCKIYQIVNFATPNLQSQINAVAYVEYTCTYLYIKTHTHLYIYTLHIAAVVERSLAACKRLSKLFPTLPNFAS